MEKQKKFKLIQEIFSLAIISLVVISSFFFYNMFPDKVPTHWNMQGEIDNWSNRTVGAFSIPAVLIVLYIMFQILPKIDPKKERYVQFMKPYRILQNMIIVFMAILYFLTGFFALGYEVPIDKIVPAMIGVLFIIIGNYFGKIKRNWFVGIKTPWTLSSENVWNKTHRLGGKLFVLGGFIMILIPWFMAQLKIYLFIFVIVILSLVPIVYSYFSFKKENKGKK